MARPDGRAPSNASAAAAGGGKYSGDRIAADTVAPPTNAGRTIDDETARKVGRFVRGQRWTQPRRAGAWDRRLAHDADGKGAVAR